MKIMEKRLNAEQFHSYMNNMILVSEDKLPEVWYSCFNFMLSNMNFRKREIKRLYQGLQFSCWKDLHIENTMFRDSTKYELREYFDNRCQYISDRYNLDRIFHLHWCFCKLNSWED